MYKYRNTITGSMILTTCPITGKQWELLPAAVSASKTDNSETNTKARKIRKKSATPKG